MSCTYFRCILFILMQQKHVFFSFCLLGTGTNVCYMEELRNIEKNKDDIEKAAGEEMAAEAEDDRVTEARSGRWCDLTSCDLLFIHLFLVFKGKWREWRWELEVGDWDVENVYKHWVGGPGWWRFSGWHHHTLWHSGGPKLTQPWKAKVWVCVRARVLVCVCACHASGVLACAGLKSWPVECTSEKSSGTCCWSWPEEACCSKDTSPTPWRHLEYSRLNIWQRLRGKRTMQSSSVCQMPGLCLLPSSTGLLSLRSDNISENVSL